MARVLGSYPIGRWFESCCRYHFGPLVKRLRHRPFTAESWVQFPYGSPDSNARKHKLSGIFSFCGVRCGEGTRCAVSFFVWERIGQEQNALSGCTKSIVQEQNDSRTVAPKRLIQLSAAGEVFLEGEQPSESLSADSEIPAPCFWRTGKVGEKSDSFSRAERTRPLRPCVPLAVLRFWKHSGGMFATDIP